MARSRAEVAAGDDAPRRLSMSQIVTMLLARSSSEHSSVSLSRNSKGATQIEVTVRTGEHDDVATIDAAADKARELYDELCEQYPHEAPDA